MKSPPLSLLAFLVTTIISLLLVAPSVTPSVPMALTKILPIVCLVWFLLVEERGRGESRWILAGLGFSMVGDYYLVWPETHFLHGLSAFLVAQVLYSIGLGFSKSKWLVGLGVYGAAAGALVQILPILPTPAHKVAVTVYSIAINMVLWRAVDRLLIQTSLPFGCRLSGALGAIIFCVSDTSYAFLQIGQLVPHLQAQLVILSTYYTAQVLHALGAAHSFWGRRTGINPRKSPNATKTQKTASKKKLKKKSK